MEEAVVGAAVAMVVEANMAGVVAMEDMVDGDMEDGVAAVVRHGYGAAMAVRGEDIMVMAGVGVGICFHKHRQ
jgi:hypothetical protein